MQRIDNIKRAAAEIYWQIQEEITNSTLMEYMYHDVRLESNSNLPKWVGRKILSKKVVNEKRFKSKDILLAQNLHRAIAFVRRMADIPKHDFTENDIKNLYNMVSGAACEYRTNNIDTAPKWHDIPKYMTELVNFINSRKLRPVERAAFTHYRVVQIQPFPNFNNVVARLVMNFILIRHRYPLTIVKADDKQEYLDCLTKDSIYFLQFVTSKVLGAVNSNRLMTRERLDRNHPSIKLGLIDKSRNI
ncbi:MAG TPA: Fic family protein [Bacteroidia bacterium]|nr:Fic family protein [Bacteroidia bacterium]